MRKICQLSAFLVILAGPVLATEHPVSPISDSTNPRAAFEKIDVDYKAAQNGINGMLIHLKFTAYDLKDVDASLAIYFSYNDSHRGVLKDTNQKYYSSAGDVAVYKDIKPSRNPELFDDVQVFMPYSELDLPPGDYDLTMEIRLIYGKGGLISNLTEYDFTFTKPLLNSSTVPSSSIDSVKLEHNVTENGKIGIRIEVTNLSVTGMKDGDPYLAIYFEKKDGTKLQSNSSQYKTRSGNAAIFQTLKLPYEVSVFDKLKLFIPYEELNLGKGKFDLRLDVDVLRNDGTLLRHMRLHEFQVDL